MAKSVCYLVPGVGIGGGMIVILEHANRLKDKGFDVCLLNIGREDRLDWFAGNRVPVYSVFADHPRNPDVLVATGWETSYMAMLLGLEPKRWVYFVQSDETRFFPPNMLEVLLIRNSYFLPFEHLTEAGWIQDWLRGNFGQEAVYAPNGLNEKVIYEGEPLSERRPDRVRILLEGPIAIEFKGMDDAFRAVQNLDAEIWCVSSAGGLKDWYRCDRFFEKVPFSEMRKIYSSCDVLLKMSKVEGFFGPPLEMMACGGTAVTTRVTGYDEYLVDGYNGLTTELGDYHAAHECLRRLIADRGLLERLKQNGRQTAAKMRWEPTIEILARFYEQPAAKSFAFASAGERSFAFALAEFTRKLVVDWRLGALQDDLFALMDKQNRINQLLSR